MVLATDKDNQLWNTHRFEIRYVKQTNNKEVQASRTFTVPKTERDMWVCAISKALLLHEKQKAKARKAASMENETSAVSPRTTVVPDSRPWSPVYDSVWAGDQFVTLEKQPSSTRRMGSPPSSPRPSSKRPLPRHDILAGESLA